MKHLLPIPARQHSRRSVRSPGRDGEHQEQTALIAWARSTSVLLPELALLFAIPNGGHRHKGTARRLKAEGVQAGVPDLCLPVPRGGYHGLFIELKTRQGRERPQQRYWRQCLSRQGYQATVCHGWPAARQQLIHYLQGECP